MWFANGFANAGPAVPLSRCPVVTLVALAADPGHQQAADDQASERVSNFAVGFQVGLNVLLHGEGNIGVADAPG